MYLEFFELKERPYSMSPDPRFIYLTDQHSEALAKCEYTIQEKMGLSVIHGDVGAGKTTLARRLWEKYEHDPKFNFAMLVDPNYPTPFQFINEVRRELNIYTPSRSFGDALNPQSLQVE
jgi:general secretion pathway protein A